MDAKTLVHLQDAFTFKNKKVQKVLDIFCLPNCSSKENVSLFPPQNKTF